MSSHAVSYLLGDFWQVICQKLCLNFLIFLSFLSLFFFWLCWVFMAARAFLQLWRAGAGYSLIVVCRLLAAVTSVMEHRLYGMGFSSCSSLALEEGVPDLPVAPQDEAGLTKTFQTWPRGWFHIP